MRFPQAPLWLDTTGGWQTIKDLKGASAQLRAAVYAEAAVKKALFLEPAVTPATTAKPSPAAALVRPPKASAMANPTAFYQAFPKLPSVRKRISLLRCHFYTENDLLTRQARDKHRESTQKETRFCRRTSAPSCRRTWRAWLTSSRR
eukprot:COSAG06_NODE_18170_length_900_cov_2.287141_2_plen_146_part_01